MTAPHIMRGFTELRTRIAAFLEGNVPHVIDVMRDHYGLDAYRLPYPAKYDWYDITLVNEYPAVGLVPAADRAHDRRDITHTSAKEYWSTYAVRVFVLALSPLDVAGQLIGAPKAEALRLRDDLLAAVQVTLLETPSLKSNGAIEFREETLNSDYLEPYQVNTQNPRWIAGAIISADFRFTQHTVSAPYGRAGTLSVEADKLHP